MDKKRVASNVSFSDSEYKSFHMAENATLTIYMISWEEEPFKVVFKHATQFLYKLGGCTKKFGDIDHIEGSIFELRFHVGAGYRIYYAKKRNKVVILLCGGSKRSQKRDIEKAKQYWQDLGG